jgi:hypothetical protein
MDPIKTVIFVLGMHRSGSSAFTGAINKYWPEGVSFGRLVGLVNESNPKGFFESEHILSFNHHLMLRLGVEWYDTKSLSKEVYQNVYLNSTNFARLREIFLNDFGNCDTIVIKDPRIIVLWELYTQVMKDLGWKYKIVTITRSNQEICQSLIKRNNSLFPTPNIALDLCNFYKNKLNTLLIAAENNDISIFQTTFDNLVNDPIQVLEDMSKTLKDFPDTNSECAKNVMQFIDKKLKHFNQKAI